MKIYSGDTWTLEELQEQVADAGRRSLTMPFQILAGANRFTLLSRFDAPAGSNGSNTPTARSVWLTALLMLNLGSKVPFCRSTCVCAIAAS